MSSIVKLTDAERERREAMKEVALVDSPSISNNDRTAADLQSARLSFELELHNLQSEFLIREDRIKQTYLNRVREIVGLDDLPPRRAITTPTGRHLAAAKVAVLFHTTGDEHKWTGPRNLSPPQI